MRRVDSLRLLLRQNSVKMGGQKEHIEGAFNSFVGIVAFSSKASVSMKNRARKNAAISCAPMSMLNAAINGRNSMSPTSTRRDIGTADNIFLRFLNLPGPMRRTFHALETFLDPEKITPPDLLEEYKQMRATMSPDNIPEDIKYLWTIPPLAVLAEISGCRKSAVRDHLVTLAAQGMIDLVSQEILMTTGLNIPEENTYSSLIALADGGDCLRSDQLYPINPVYWEDCGPQLLAYWEKKEMWEIVPLIKKKAISVTEEDTGKEIIKICRFLPHPALLEAEAHHWKNPDSATPPPISTPPSLANRCAEIGLKKTDMLLTNWGQNVRFWGRA